MRFDYSTKNLEDKKVLISSNPDSYMRILISTLFIVSFFSVSPIGRLNAGSWMQIEQKSSFWSQKPSHTFWFRKLNSIEKFAKHANLSSIFVPREEIRQFKNTFPQPINERACTQLKQKCIQKLLSLKNGESLYFEFEDASDENFYIKRNLRRMQAPYPVNDDGMIDEDGHFTCQICADYACGSLDLNCPINKLPMLPAIEIYAEKELSPWIKNMITSCIAPQSWIRLHKKTAGALAITGLLVGHELLTEFNGMRRIKQIKRQRARNARLKKIESEIKQSSSLLIQTLNGIKYPWLSLTKNTAQEIKMELNSTQKKVFVSALDLPFSYNAADLVKYFPLFKKLFPEDTKSGFGSPDKSSMSPKINQLRVLVIPLSVICRLTYHEFFESMLHTPHRSSVNSFVEKLNEFGWKLLIIPDFLQEDDYKVTFCINETVRPDAIQKPSSNVECLLKIHFPQKEDDQANEGLKLHWVLYPDTRNFYRSSKTTGCRENIKIEDSERSNALKLTDAISAALINC